MLAGFCLSACSTPVLLVLLLKWASRCLELKGCQECFFLGCGLLLACLCALLVQVTLQVIFAEALESDAGLILLVAYSMVLGITNLVVFFFVYRCRGRHDPSTQ